MSEKSVILLLVLFAGHWAADYTHLSRPWMLAAKRIGSPVAPIFWHALIHAVIVGLILIPACGHWAVRVALLFAIELITHLLIDVLKGRINVWFSSLSSPANPYHWYVFGADQWLHHAVLVLIAFFALK